MANIMLYKRSAKTTRKKSSTPKRPKKPKISSSITVWENYDKRMKAWVDKLKKKQSDKVKKQQLIRKYS